MTPERWARVKAILGAALEQRRDQRTAFVDLACGSDDTLRKEVLSLLAHEEPTNDVLGRRLLASALNLWNYVRRSSPGSPPAVEPAPPTFSTGQQHTSSRPTFFWVSCAIGLGFVILYAHGVRTIYTHGDTTIMIGWEAAVRGDAWIVTRVDPEGPAANILQIGDEITAFNADSRARVVGHRPYARFLQPDAAYSVRIRRDGEHDHALRVSAIQQPGTAVIAGVYVALSVCFCLMALTVGFLKPQDHLPRLGALAGSLAALPLLAPAFDLYRGLDTGAAFVLSDAVWLTDQLYLAVGFHFFLCLSYPGVQPRFWVGVKRFLYAVCALQVAVNAVTSLATYAGQETLITLAYGAPWVADLDTLLFRSSWWVALQIVAYASICTVIASGYHWSGSRDQRRRIGWVAFGGVLGLAPAIIYFVASLAVELAGKDQLLDSTLWENAGRAASCFLIVIPLTLAYAVVRHRVMNIRVVVRRTLQYILATRALQAVLLLPVVGLLWPVMTNPDRTVAELFPPESLYLNLPLLSALTLGLHYRQRVRRWLDRRFFREAYREEMLLGELVRQIKDLDSLQDIATLVGREVSAALHPEFVLVYHRLHVRGPFALSHWSGEASADVRALVASEVDRLSAREFGRPISLMLPSTTRPERTDSALLVPVNDSSGGLTGVLVLGGKKSEEAYGPMDRHLLQAVADQVAVTHENLRLRERVGEAQRLRTDVLGHLVGEGVNMLLECPACGLCFDADADTCSDDSAELTRLLPIERLIGGRYRLDRRLGEGGMGAVYEATDLQLQRKVAAKVMVARLFGNRQALRRFEREAHAAARLNHPNIVALHDFGQIRTDAAYLIMERIYGTTWRAELKRRGVLPVAVLIEWLAQLLDGLAAAHAAGVVHRDLKPENVLIVPTPGGGNQLKIVDFGLAKIAVLKGGDTESLTRQGCAMGTLGYMPPEQLRGQAADQRSDVFAVGVMIVEAITGAQPFVGDTPEAVLGAMEHYVLRLPGPRSAVTRELADVLAMCLHYDTSARFRSVEQMREPVLASLRACDWAAVSNDDPAPVPAEP
jgi:eukaryotic-like serine/threonine-protein kinase